LDFLIETLIEVLGYFFLSGEDREWSIFRTALTLGVVILLMAAAYKFFS
jgi:hypothetical protein